MDDNSGSELLSQGEHMLSQGEHLGERALSQMLINFDAVPLKLAIVQGCTNAHVWISPPFATRVI